MRSLFWVHGLIGAVLLSLVGGCNSEAEPPQAYTLESVVTQRLSYTLQWPGAVSVVGLAQDTSLTSVRLIHEGSVLSLGAPITFDASTSGFASTHSTSVGTVTVTLSPTRQQGAVLEVTAAAERLDAIVHDLKIPSLARLASPDAVLDSSMTVAFLEGASLLVCGAASLSILEGDLGLVQVRQPGTTLRMYLLPASPSTDWEQQCQQAVASPPVT